VSTKGAIHTITDPTAFFAPIILGAGGHGGGFVPTKSSGVSVILIGWMQVIPALPAMPLFFSTTASASDGSFSLPDIPAALAREQGVLYRFLLNAWYFDRIYDFLFVRPTMWLGRLFWKGGDGFVIDGFGPDGVSARVLDVTRNVVRLQTGYLYHYAFAMLIGVAFFVTWFMFLGAPS